MARRSIITSRKLRLPVLAVGIFFILLALVSCMVRVARIWSASDGQGGSIAHGVIVEHGRLRWEANHNSAAMIQVGELPPTVLNWQVDPGFTWTTYRHAMQSFAVPGGMFTANRREITIALPLLLIGCACLLMSIRWLPTRPGCCACGYDLHGLQSNRCPECGSTRLAG